MSNSSYTLQLFSIVKHSKRAISYEGAAKRLKANNPQLEDTEKNTLIIKRILEKLHENGKISKTKTGSFKM